MGCVKYIFKLYIYIYLRLKHVVPISKGHGNARVLAKVPVIVGPSLPDSRKKRSQKNKITWVGSYIKVLFTDA